MGGGVSLALMVVVESWVSSLGGMAGGAGDQGQLGGCGG